MDYSQIILEKKDRIALITLNRPERLNAWTFLMEDELMDAIEQSNNDVDIGSIVLTGAGKGFCAGADFKDTLSSRRERATEVSFAKSWVRLMRNSKPLIAAVNGVAVGVGITSILPFDVIFASDRAKFGVFFVKMGLVPELGSTHFLVQRMGFGAASEMCLSGRTYDARESYEKGLVDYIVPHDKLMQEAMKVAGEIAQNPSRQLRLIKQLLTLNGSETDLSLVVTRELEMIEKCYGFPEYDEAVTAFLEKRPPKFR